MASPRVAVLCPDYNEPSGGVRRLYRHVDVLNRHGLAAFLCHSRPGFRCTWFDHTTAVADLGALRLTAGDYLVVPEIYGPDLARLLPGVPKVVFNQNSYLTFQGYTLDKDDLRTPYTHPEVLATLVVSEDNLAYLRHAFPGHRFVRVHYGIDPELFAYRADKRPVIAYMPRKHAGDAAQVFNVLKFRGVLAGLELAAVAGRTERQAAEALGGALLFFSFGYPERCPLPPLEAMACGCVVVGYHGFGGREYFREEFSYPVEAGDVLGFARRAEEAIFQWRGDPGAALARGERAAAYVREQYSPRREEWDIVAFWEGLLAGRLVTDRS